MQGITDEIFQIQAINKYLYTKSISMTFDNTRTIIIQRLTLFGATVIFLAYIVLTYFAKLIKYPLIGMSDTAWTVMLVIIYLFIVFLPIFRKYQFVYYSDDGDSIVFRYFDSGIFGGRKNSVEIKKHTFSGYKTESTLFGLKQRIILFQNFKEGVAKYPPVYITALTYKEREKVIRSLTLFTPRV
jgi:hypothetical protein